MTVQTNGDGAQAATTGTPGQGQAPTGNQDPQGTTGQEPGNGAQSGQFDLSSIQDPALREYLEGRERELAEARQEAARYRTSARTAAEQAEAIRRQNETAEQAAQREAQERQDRLEALERENRELKVGGVVRDEASKAKAFSPDRVYALIKDDVEVDDHGRPTNVGALLAGLQQTDPYLFQRTPAGADAGAGRGTGAGVPTGGINDLLRSGAQTRAR